MNKFGRLTLIKEVDERNKYGSKMAIFRCNCGHIGLHTLYRVKNGSIVSCGCSRIKPDTKIKQSYQDYKYRSKKKLIDFGIPFESFKEYVLSACYYCGVKPTTHHGIDRIYSDLGYVEGNLVSCCGTCNMMKNDLHPDVFKLHIKKIYETMFQRQA